MDENKENIKYLLPPKSSNKKTLVLDLDETLVHSQFLEFSCPSDIIIKIEIEQEIYDIHVLIRPGVRDFLETMKNYYEIVIFTASISKYADILLNIIDPRGCCNYRLFREHCTFINNIFVKDLKRLGRDLKDIIIVDNSPFSYSFHPDNGLPILSWFEDKNDRELNNITPLLIFLSKVNDVREYIPKLVVNNTISYLNIEKLFKNNAYNYKKNNKNSKNNNNLEIYNYGNDLKNTELVEKNNNKNSKEYNISIQIVQNNINNINTIIDDNQTAVIKNKLIKFLNIENNEPRNIQNKKPTCEKFKKINQKNIIVNIDNPFNNILLTKKNENNKTNRRQNNLSSINNNIKINKSKSKDKYYRKINNKNFKNNKNIRELINKIHRETIKKNDKSVRLKQIQNIMNKKRKKLETPNNLNFITFSKNNNKVINNNYQKKLLKFNSSSSKNKKRNNSNNDRTKLLLPLEYSDFNLNFIKNQYTLSYKARGNNFNQKRNLNNLNLLRFKTKFKSNSNYGFSNEKNDTMNNSINNNKYSLNIFKKLKMEDIVTIPSHRKQNSYNENNIFLNIKKNLIKSHDSKTKRFINKNDFLKNEIQKVNISNKSNTNVCDYKNKLIKRTYGNFKKINLKNIDFVTKKDKKRLQIELKTKNDKNLNRFNLNCNIFNLYKTLNTNLKNDESNNLFNNTTDKLLNDKSSFRKVNHQKTISYNFDSSRNINSIIPKNKFQNKFKINNISKIKSTKRQSQNEMDNFQLGNKSKKKDDNFIYIKNMFKNKFFDCLYYTKDNVNNNLIETKFKNRKRIEINLKK